MSDEAETTQPEIPRLPDREPSGPGSHARSEATAAGEVVYSPAVTGLHGSVLPPGDKSISHRAVLLGAVSGQPVSVEGFLASADTQATVAAVRALGVTVEELSPEHLIVHGAGWEGLREPDDVIDVRNAGTLIRLLPGLVASCRLLAILTGDASIRRRPMARILGPLRAMGVEAWGRDGGRLPPIALRGGPIRGIDHRMDVASAQVKSCILLAGLKASGETVVVEPGPTRDHTERLLRLGGACVERDGSLTAGGRVRVLPIDGPLGLSAVRVPGDLSSGAFPLVAALLVPDSSVSVVNVGLNPTRTGLLEVLRAMGGRITITPHPADGEPVGDIRAETSDLTAVEIGGKEFALMVDEAPVWALAAARARGISRLRGAAELRVKESDRLAAIAQLLRAIGVPVREHEDGLDIEGRPDGWFGGSVRTHGDHRIAMTAAVAGLASQGGVSLDDDACIGISYPAFADTMAVLAGRGMA